MFKVIVLACLLASMANALCSSYSYTSCSSCVAGGACGWCSSTSTCMSGSSSGPSSSSGYCSFSNWNYWSSDCTGGSGWYIATSSGISAWVVFAIVFGIIMVIVSVTMRIFCWSAILSRRRQTVVVQNSAMGQPINNGYPQQPGYPQQQYGQQQQYPQPQGYAPAPQQGGYGQPPQGNLYGPSN